jgi:hypothetical protein
MEPRSTLTVADFGELWWAGRESSRGEGIGEGEEWRE